MSKQHTPGPWLEPREINGKGMGWRAGPAWLGSDSCSEETKANAYLIAAAPDLLEALQRLVANLDEGDFISTTRIDEARAAIAKATGETL